MQAKLKKVSPGQHSLEASVPCQGLSIDFAFAGMVSKDKKRCADVEEMNGETCFLLIQDEFTKMVHSDVCISKAPPVEFINKFLQTHAPVECQDKFVTLDQGTVWKPTNPKGVQEAWPCSVPHGSRCFQTELC